MERIGIFGGSFNPVHNGHLAAARAASEILKLDRLIIVPCGRSAYGKALMPAALRLKLLQKALSGEKKFVVSDIEVKRPGVSRTITTLRELKKGEKKKAQYFLLIGQDQVSAFPSWQEAEALARMTKICVMKRPGMWNSNLIHKKFRMKLLNIPQYEISSSDVRHRLLNNLSIKWLVPDSILALLLSKKRHQ